MAVRDTKNSGSHNASRKYGVICRQEEACIVRKMGGGILCVKRG